MKYTMLTILIFTSLFCIAQIEVDMAGDRQNEHYTNGDYYIKDMNGYFDDLYSFELPNSTQTKLDNLGSGFQHQPIEDGNVAVTNVDYYGVEITQLPDVNGNGQQDESPEEVFEAFRLEFANLASGNADGFESECPGGGTSDILWSFEYYGAPHHSDINYDELNWLDISTDGTPLNTIFYIDGDAVQFLPNLIADDGAIIISEYVSNSHFIGSTISTPRSGSQPFSGNRQWGYVINSNGNMEIYTKAIDVAHLAGIFNLMPSCATQDYYNIAKETWKNLQNEVEDWIEQSSNNGQASILEPKQALIPNNKVEELLTHSTEINENELSCE